MSLPTEIWLLILALNPELISKLMLVNKEYSAIVTSIKDDAVSKFFNRCNKTKCMLSYELFIKIKNKYPLLLDIDFLYSYCEKVNNNDEYADQKNPYNLSLIFATENNDLDVIKFICENHDKFICYKFANDLLNKAETSEDTEIAKYHFISPLFILYRYFYEYYNPESFHFLSENYTDDGDYLGALYDHEIRMIEDYSVYHDNLYDDNGNEIMCIIECDTVRAWDIDNNTPGPIIKYFLELSKLNDTFIIPIYEIHRYLSRNQTCMELIMYMKKYGMLLDFLDNLPK